MSVSNKLLSRIFNILEILISFNYHEIIISKKSLFLGILKSLLDKKLYICKNTQVYVFKISSRYLEKWTIFGVLKVETATFHAVPWDFCSFFFVCLLFSISSDLAGSKCVLGSFFAFLTKNWPKPCITPQNTKFLVWSFLSIMTLNVLDHKYAFRELRTILRSVPDTSHVVYWLTSIWYGCSARQN